MNEPQQPRLLDQVRQCISLKHMSRKTEESYVYYIREFIFYDVYDIRTVPELLGHKDVRTTMIYTHVLNRGGRGVRSPLAP